MIQTNFLGDDVEIKKKKNKYTFGGLKSWQQYKDKAFHYLSLGAGRQSSVMYLMALNGEIEHSPNCAIFADTGNEPEHVYSQLQFLIDENKKTGGKIPIYVVSAGDLLGDSMAAINGNDIWGDLPDGSSKWGGVILWAGNAPLKRLCTIDYKIQPTQKLAKKLMIENGFKFLVDWRGHTVDEIHRAKQDKRRFYWCRWPLLEKRYSDNDCAVWLQKNGYPEFLWSACIVCPFRLNQLEYAKKVKLMYPERWENEVIKLDNSIRDMSRFGINSTCYLNSKQMAMNDFVELEEIDNGIGFDFCDNGCGL